MTLDRSLKHKVPNLYDKLLSRGKLVPKAKLEECYARLREPFDPESRTPLRLFALVAVLLVLPLRQSGATVPTNESPFQIRGVKGLWWDGIQNYREMVRWLPSHGFNFLMFCYSSFPGSGAKWREPYSEKELAGMREVAKYGKAHGINVCLSVNPAIWSQPPLVYGREEEVQRLVAKYLSVHAAGVRWFSLCLDDIAQELTPEDKTKFASLAEAQSHFVNEVFHRLRVADPRVELIFCPSAYTTDSARGAQDYITTVGKLTDPDVKFFWTGPTVCSPKITGKDADEFAAWIRRKPIIWDNYPVNDYASWRLFVSPVKNRDPDLGQHVLGLMSNPMKQSEISKLPLATIGAYLRDPAKYNSALAVEKALAELGRGRLNEALRALVEVYGERFLGEPGFGQLPPTRTLKEARALKTKLEDLLADFRKQRGFQRLAADVCPAVEADLQRLQHRVRALAGPHEPPLLGLDFAGGAAELFGSDKFNREVNYVYAAATPNAEMTAKFLMGTVDTTGRYVVSLEARDDDFPSKAHISIQLNDVVLFEGESDFPDGDWETRKFPVAGTALRIGENTLTLRCTDKQGVVGMPPWFMVSRVDVLPEERANR